MAFFWVTSSLAGSALTSTAEVLVP